MLLVPPVPGKRLVRWLLVLVVTLMHPPGSKYEDTHNNARLDSTNCQKDPRHDPTHSGISRSGARSQQESTATLEKGPNSLTFTHLEIGMNRGKTEIDITDKP